MATPARLAESVHVALASADNVVLVSAATAWEIAIKHALGRLELRVQEFDEVLARMGFEPLPIQPRHAIAAGALPHRIAA